MKLGLRHFVVSIIFTFFFVHGNLYSKALNSKNNNTVSRIFNIYIDKAVHQFPEITKSSPEAFQLISHGRPGALFIHGQWRSSKEIVSFIQTTIKLPATIKYLNIYGCEFAKGKKGLKAVAYLEQALGLHIAASNNITGKNGDWKLEVGDSKTALAFNNYQDNLQVVGGTGLADDFDGDGVNNLNDIDDDNDGVLDAMESPSCFYNKVEISVPKLVTTTLASPAGVNGNIANTFDNNFSTQFRFTAASLLVNATVFEITPQYPIKASDIKLYYNSVSGNAVGTSLLNVEGWNGTSWVTLSSGLLPGNAVANVQTFAIPAANQNVYSKYRLQMPAGSVTAAPITEVVLTPSSDYQPSLYPKPSCSNDIDGDGKNNHQDLDSDGDGCSDALEGGATTNTAANYTFSGISMANGYATSLQTGNNGISNYTSIYYQYAIINTAKACLDNDGDGKIDAVDLDDDNDGILDTDEILCGNCSTAYPNSSSKVVWSSITAGAITKNGQTLNVTASSTTSASNLMDISWGTLYGTGGVSGFTGCPSNVVATNTNTALNYNSSNYTVTYTFSKPVSNPSLSFASFDGSGVNFPQPVYVSGMQSPVAGVAIGSYITSYPPTENIVSVIYTGVYTSISFSVIGNDNQGNVILNIDEILPAGSPTFISSNYSTCKDIDTDNDGIPNRLDIDSDGDGCTDANEYYNSSTASGADGGAYGTNPVTVDVNGKVTTTATTTIAPSYSGGNYANATNASIFTACCELTTAMTATSASPTTCTMPTGSITLTNGGIIANKVYSISYTLAGVVTTTNITANSSSQIIIAGLAAGSYSNVTVTSSTLALCTVIKAGPFVINSTPAPPSATIGTITAVCQGISSFNIPYSAATGGGNQYSITSSDLTGFTPVINTTLPATPIGVSIPSTAAAGTYHFSLTLKNTTNGCTSNTIPLTVTINTTPAVTPGAVTQVCQGAASFTLPYTINAGSPNQYSLTSTLSGFTPITNASLPASPITVTIPASATPNTYTFNLSVKNTTNTCLAGAQPVTVTINPTPTVNTQSVNVSYCNGDIVPSQPLAGTPSGTIVYDITGGTAIGLPNQTGVSQIPGFTATNGGTTIISATIIITPRINGSTCTGTPKSFTVTVNPTPNVATPVYGSYCSGTTVAAQALSGGSPTGVVYDITGGAAIGLSDQNNVTGIPAFTAVNNSNAAISAVVKLIPKANGCTGIPKEMVITVNPCVDADGDGIYDYIDLDDDNDGVLDATESVECDQCQKYDENTSRVVWNSSFTTTLANATFTKAGQSINITASVTAATPVIANLQSTIFNTNGAGNGYTGCPANPLQVINNSDLNTNGTNYVFSITFSSPVRDPALVFSSFNGTGAPVFNQNVYVSGIGGSNASVISSLPPIGSYIRSLPLTSSDYTMSVIFPGVYSAISFTESGSDGYGGLGLYINQIVPGTIPYVANQYVAYCKDIDTDGDGIPNRLDLDSDGDGCPDLVEAGVNGLSGTTFGFGTLINTGTSVNKNYAKVTGTYGNNGFANTIETNDVASAAYNGTYTYSKAINASDSSNCNPLKPLGTIVGGTICESSPGILTFTATSGTAPYTLIIKNVSTGTNTTYTGITSGGQIIVLPSPGVTTNYQLLKVTDINNYSSP